MHVGLGIVFQGLGEGRNDRDVYRHELALGDLAEPLGFSSLWGVEHHFTEYTMCPDVLQMLTYFAGRTRHIRLGSMVVVLPWHDPMRVAEQVAMLDHMSGGRMVLGIGRGLGRVEFEGFGVAQEESREIFSEAAQMLLEGLEKGYCEFDGRHVKQVRREIRPRPFASFRGRSYAAAVSPESSTIMARLGIGILVIPQKPWEAVASELAAYRSVYLEANGADAPAPIVAGWTICDEDAGRAEEAAQRWIGEYYRSVLRHYELVGDHLGKMKGYEAYAEVQRKATENAQAMVDFFVGLQTWGTPEQCYARILDVRERTGADSFIGVFSFGGMPYERVGEGLRLFAREVLPELEKLAPVADWPVLRPATDPAASSLRVII